MCFAPQQRAHFRHLNLQKWSKPLVFLTFWPRNVLRATTACTFSTSQLPKVVRQWCVLYILTSKCASRHNGVHFFDIATSKSGPTMVCFVHFDLEMCFAPQRRALFNISTAKSGPTMVCFVHFDLQMCFAPQRCAIFHLSSGQLAPHPPLQRAYFSTLRSPKSLEKHSASRLSYLFTHLHLLSSYSFSSTLLSSNLSLLSASSLLCFSSVHIVGSLTSKLPSNIYIYISYSLLNAFECGYPYDVSAQCFALVRPENKHLFACVANFWKCRCCTCAMFNDVMQIHDAE